MLTIFGLGLVLGAWVSAFAIDVRLKRALDRHERPVVIRAGSNEYTVKVTQLEEFGPPWEDPWRWLKRK